MKKEIELKILDEMIRKNVPSYETIGSAGMDLRACIEDKILLKPRETVLIPMGFAMHISNPELAAMVLPRSGLGSKYGIVLGNLIGLIDSDYQGEIMTPIWNRSENEFIINRGDRIAQMIIVPIVHASFKIVKEFNKSERGVKGFGSSGIK
jgi:dUTP pyrophosphatase